MRIIKTIAFIVILGVMCGCQSISTTFTIASTHNVRFDLTENDKVSRDKGRDFRFWLFYIPIFGGAPNMKEATDRLLEKYDANLLLNVTVDHKEYGLPPILGASGYVVEGDVYNLK